MRIHPFERPRATHRLLFQTQTQKNNLVDVQVKMRTSAATYDGIERGKSQWLPHGLVKVRHCDGVVARDNRSWNAVVSEPPARAARERVEG